MCPDLTMKGGCRLCCPLPSSCLLRNGFSSCNVHHRSVRQIDTVDFTQDVPGKPKFDDGDSLQGYRKTVWENLIELRCGLIHLCLNLGRELRRAVDKRIVRIVRTQC